MRMVGCYQIPFPSNLNTFGNGTSLSSLAVSKIVPYGLGDQISHQSKLWDDDNDPGPCSVSIFA